jgi:hypothetical protein
LMDGLRPSGHHEREGYRGQSHFRYYVEEFHERSPYEFVFGPVCSILGHLRVKHCRLEKVAASANRMHTRVRI